MHTHTQTYRRTNTGARVHTHTHTHTHTHVQTPDCHDIGNFSGKRLRENKSVGLSIQCQCIREVRVRGCIDLPTCQHGNIIVLLLYHCRRVPHKLQFSHFFHVPSGSPRGGDVLRFMSDISKPSSPTPYSLLVSLSVFMALSTVFHSMTSPDNSLFSDTVLPVLSLPYWSFQLCTDMIHSG